MVAQHTQSGQAEECTVSKMSAKQEQLKQKYKKEQEALWNDESPVNPSVCEDCTSEDTYFVQGIHAVAQRCRSCESQMRMIQQKTKLEPCELHWNYHKSSKMLERKDVWIVQSPFSFNSNVRICLECVHALKKEQNELFGGDF